jgi:ferredoxin-NADP reductase
MAVQRTARVTAVDDSSAAAGVRALVLAMPEPLGFVGGQYLIVDSGLTLPSGKAAKRAYSLLGADSEQQVLELAVKGIAAGPVSGFLHRARVGDEIKFSGPWGRMSPPDGASGATLVLATDTGVTAALGLLQGQRMRPLLAQTTFVWLRTGPDYFLPDDRVRARLPAGLGAAEVDVLPPVHHPERIAWVRARLAALLRPGRLAQAYLAGDGAVNYALLDDLVAAGVPATRDNVESFFNMPRKAA